MRTLADARRHERDACRIVGEAVAEAGRLSDDWWWLMLTGLDVDSDGGAPCGLEPVWRARLQGLREAIDFALMVADAATRERAA